MRDAVIRGRSTFTRFTRHSEHHTDPAEAHGLISVFRRHVEGVEIAAAMPCFWCATVVPRDARASDDFIISPAFGRPAVGGARKPRLSYEARTLVPSE